MVRMHRSPLAWVVLAAFPLLAIGGWLSSPLAAQGPAPGVLPSNEERNAATRERLQQPIRVEFVDVSIQDGINFFTDLLIVQSHVDSKALQVAGITNEATITLSLDNVPGDTALELALEQVGLAYYLRSGVVIVTTRGYVENLRETRVYAVPDLLAHAGNPRENLADLISATVEPDSWELQGGLGVIRNFQGTLVITQNPIVHQKIEQFLLQLRKATQAAPVKKPWVQEEEEEQESPLGRP